MAGGIAEINPAPAATAVDRHVVDEVGAASVGDALALDAPEYGVEFVLAHLEGVMVAFEFGPRIEIEGQRLVDPNGREVPGGALGLEPEDAREELGRNLFVARRNDRPRWFIFDSRRPL